MSGIETLKRIFVPNKEQVVISKAERIVTLLKQDFDIQQQSDMLIEMRNLLIEDRKKEIHILTLDLEKLETM